MRKPTALYPAARLFVVSPVIVGGNLSLWEKQLTLF
jgi:hypothetical protein